MKLSPSPDLGSDRRLLWTAAALTLMVVCIVSFVRRDIGASLGDTDDAMRLVLVRHLMDGGGWYDQLVTRLQPPQGVYLHWSRLVDGGLAGLSWLFGLVMPRAAAETAVRFVWPQLWIAPAVVCGLVLARRAGGRGAVFTCALMIALNLQLFTQFQPGRVDHHQIQIVCALVAAAGAMARRRRILMSAIAGAVSALGLAVGMESLVFQALVGAAFALRAGLDPEAERKPAMAYGLALALGTLVLFAVQTPPWRWGVPACDALGLNLVAAVMLGGLGLAAVAAWPGRLALWLRLVLLAGVGAGALAAYLAFDPACIHGPFAAVDPRVRPFWFDHIGELMPWWKLVGVSPRLAFRLLTICAVSALAAGFVAVRLVRARDWNGLLPVALCLAAVAEASVAARAEGYVLWFGIPMVGAVLAVISPRLWRNLMVPTVIAAAAFSPTYVAALLTLAVPGAHATEARENAMVEHCFDSAPYRPLAGLAPGVVLGEIDLGPFVLANSPHSVLSAPYHRMTWGILAAHDALSAPPGEDERKVRALHVAYVIDCPAHQLRTPPSSLAARLRSSPPPWLEKLTPPGARVQAWRVKPAE
jgi:hypothetical protein